MDNDMDVRNQIITEHMGKFVHVVIDRPMGYQHEDITYPVNYGYIPGLLAADGEEQDAYILGVSKPVLEFDGQVVAAIRRKNDCEDKLVVAPAGMMYNQAEIAESVHFQEQYFVTTIDSLLRKSCGVIPFRWNFGEREYLILLQTNQSWSFPKGHMEPHETEEQTASRELYEETGLRAKLVSGKKAVLEYDIPPYTRKQVVFFIGEAEGDVVLQQSEALEHKWVRESELGTYLHKDTCEFCKRILSGL